MCKKKFRTLRERYTRELRKSYLEPSTPVKYDYFDELSFLSPYIKFRSIKFESSDGKTIVTKREDLSMDDKEGAEEMKLMEQDEYFAEEQEQHAYLDASGGQNIIYETTTVQLPEFSGSSHQIREVVQQSDDDPLCAPKSKERKRKPSWDDAEELDDNKYFAMSVACSLRRLSTINNLKAKVEIYQVLEKFSSKQELEKK